MIFKKKSYFSIVLLFILIFFIACSINLNRHNELIQNNTTDETSSENLETHSTTQSVDAAKKERAFDSTDTGTSRKYTMADLQGEIKTYTDSFFVFAVDYLADWKSTTEHATGGMDGGIVLYPDSDIITNRISIVGILSSPSRNHPQGFSLEIENFTTNSGLTGNLYRNDVKGTVEMQLHLDAYLYNSYSVYVHMDSDSFERNKNQIISVLRSIRIPFNNPFKYNRRML